MDDEKVRQAADELLKLIEENGFVTQLAMKRGRLLLTIGLDYSEVAARLRRKHQKIRVWVDELEDSLRNAEYNPEQREFQIKNARMLVHKVREELK